MNYSALHNQFIITPKELELFTLHIKYVMKSIRKELKYPIGKRKKVVGLEPIDHIEHGILNACKIIGVDFGTEWGEKLDLTDCDE